MILKKKKQNRQNNYLFIYFFILSFFYSNTNNIYIRNNQFKHISHIIIYIYNTMELIENVNIECLEFLNSLTKKQLLNYTDVKNKTKQDREQLYKRIKAYCSKLIKCNGTMKHLYKHTLNADYGRLYSGSSVQGLPSSIRGFLFKHTTDYDMENAHPKILLYLCKKHKIDIFKYSNLDYYVNNREEVLSTGDRENIKNQILKSMYSDKRNRKGGFITEIDKDFKKIQKELLSLECYKDIVENKPEHKLYNFNGSALSRILCKYENEILQDLIHYANSKNLNVSVLMFDGLMLEGQNDISAEFEEYLNSKWEGLDMKIKVKEHDNKISIPDDWENNNNSTTTYQSLLKEIEENENYNSYEVLKSKFEEEMCLIVNKSIYIKKTDEECYIFKEPQLKVSYAYLYFHDIAVDRCGNASIEKHCFISRWIKDENIRRYDDMEVIPPPLPVPSNILNMWNDFEYSKEKYELRDLTEEEIKTNEDGLNMILNHIKILCNNDDVVAEYFIKWIAHMIKYPANKSICPTLISKEGAGKGTLLRLIETIMGQKKLFQSHHAGRDVWGNFNNKMMNAFLVNLDELSKKETIEAEGRIKGLITEPYIDINVKGKSLITLRSFHRFLITTNKEEPINTSNTDRRNIIIRCSDELLNNVRYFEKINKMTNNKKVVRCFYDYLMNLNVPENFSELEKPTTEYQENLKELSKTPIDMFIEYFVRNNYDEEYVNISTSELFEEFNKFISKNKFAYDCNSLKFACRLSRLGLKGIKNARTKKERRKIFDIELLKEELNIGCNIDIDDSDSDSDSDSDGEYKNENRVIPNTEQKQLTITIGNKKQPVYFKEDYEDYNYDVYKDY